MTGRGRPLILTLLVLVGCVSARPTTHEISTDTPCGAVVFSTHDPTGDVEIFRLDPGERRPTVLTNAPLDDTAPEFSPDGEHIVFQSGRRGGIEADDAASYDIYVMKADGSDQRRLTSDPTWDIDPSWAPDGTTVVYTNIRSHDLYSIRIAGGSPQRLTRTRGMEREPRWSPDGTRIAFEFQSLPPAPEPGSTPMTTDGADAGTEAGAAPERVSPERVSPERGGPRHASLRRRPHLYIARSDGFGRRRVSPGAAPAWATGVPGGAEERALEELSKDSPPFDSDEADLHTC